MKNSLLRRATALLLSWTVPASSAWAVAPPVVASAHDSARGSRDGDRPRDDDDRRDPDHDRDDRDDRDERDDRDDRDERDCDRDERHEHGAVRPILECVAEEGPGRYTAHFGYRNENDHAVFIKHGPRNRFSPAPPDRGQPWLFRKGRTAAYPRAAFRVSFDGSELVWTLRGPDKKTRSASASRTSPRCPAPPPPCEASVFGPKRYTRSWGPPNVVQEEITLPAGVAAPYLLTVVNGDDHGKHRVSSATIQVNGAVVAGPSDFNPQVPGFQKPVSLTPKTTLTVRLESKPGSYLTLRLCGKKGESDTTAPTIAIQQPTAGQRVGSPTPEAIVSYPDERALDLASFGATIDGQPASLTAGASGATGRLGPLADGPHTLVARIKDAAGNAAEASVSFTVDTKAPQVTILRPMDGDWTNAAAIEVAGGVVDASPVSVTVDGVAAAVTGSSFTAAGVFVGDGPEVTLRALAVDAAGNEGEATVLVKVDRTAPTLRITQPAAGSLLRGSFVDVAGTYTSGSPAAIEVNGQVATVDAGGFTARVPAAEGTLTLSANLRNAAGGSATDSVSVTLDATPPVVQVSEPAPGTITRAASVTVSGHVSDASPVSLRVSGVDVPVSPDGSFAGEVPLAGNDGPSTLLFEATDAAGNVGTAALEVVIDRTAPDLSVLSPEEGAVVTGLPVVVQGMVHDQTATTVTVDGQEATRTADAWQVSFSDLPDGPHAFTVVARDAAGNETTLARQVVLELLPPSIRITSPANGSLLSAGTIDVSGTITARSAVSVTVNGIAATVAGDGFTATGVPLGEGDNTLVATVRSLASGRTGEDRVLVTRDSTPPTLALTAPETIAPEQVGQVEAQATDTTGVARIVIQVNGQVTADCTGSPCTAELRAPPDAVSGDTLVVAAEAFDAAGNSARQTRGVQVVSQGVVVGQVLADETGLPLEGATVRLVSGTTGLSTTTDAQGRFSLPVREKLAVLRIEQEGRTPAEREADVASSVGNVVVDGRLTTLGEPQVIGPDGGRLVTPQATGNQPGQAATSQPVHVTRTPEITVPQNAVTADTSFQLTPLSPQGLPGLLPLGVSPLAAFELRADAPPQLPLTARVASLGTATLHLARYRLSQHDWVVVAPSLAPTAAGELSFELPELGAYALVQADEMDPAIPIPAAGSPLEGVAVVKLPPTVTAQGLVEPSAVPPTGVTAKGSQELRSPLVAPSGTLVQAEVTETYTLASGDVASSEKRMQDILIFRTECPPLGAAVNVPPPPGAAVTVPRAPGTEPDPTALCAVFPIRASRSYQAAELAEGTVQLDILIGREGVRGRTGGSRAVEVESGDAKLSLPSRALGEDTVVSLEGSKLSAFLPQAPGLEPLRELVVDFSGQTLQLAGEVSIAANGVSAGETLVVAKVERALSGGIPRLVVVSLAEVVSDRIVTKAHPDLPGITREGRYVFYRLAAPVGLVKGITRTDSGPVMALVESAALPFVGLTKDAGGYVLVTAPGIATITARVPGTAVTGNAQVVVSALPGETAVLDITLAGSVVTATVTPANGSVALPIGAQVEINSPAPIDAASVTADRIRLEKASGEAVPVRFVLSGSRQLLAVVPQAALEFATEYVLKVPTPLTSGGGHVQVPETRFTTKADTPPVYNLNALVFSFPDAETGLVSLTAPAGSLPPGSTILVINSGNAFVASFTVENDGGVGQLVEATFPASINDRLLITITDPLGNVTTFERSKYEKQDGTVAIGPGGGTVEGPGGVELRIPAGALEKGVELKIAGVTAEELEQRFPGQVPDLQDAHVASGLKIESADKPLFRKEVDLAFPVPDFSTLPADQQPATAEDAFYYVYRRLEGPCPNGQTTCADSERLVFFDVVDHAFLGCPAGKTECTPEEKKVVTASWPFPGYTGLYGSVDALGYLSPATTSTAYLMWTFAPANLATPLPGAITGKVLRAKWNPNDDPDNPNPGAADYEAVEGALVYGEEALSQQPLFPGTRNAPVVRTGKDGAFTLWDSRYTGGTVKVYARANGEERSAVAFEANPADWTTSGLRFYRNIASANITYPAAAPPAPPPALDIRVMRLENGERKATTGMVSLGTSLVIGFNTNAIVRSAQIQGEEQTVLGPLTNDPSGFRYVLQGEFTPSRTGSHTVTATALPAFGSPITGSVTFLVVGAGGGNNEPLPDEAPRVITDRVRPKKNAEGVPVEVFPELAFTEPVRGLKTGLSLVQVDGDTPGEVVEVSLLGIPTVGDPAEITDDSATVTAVTVRPRQGLKYSTTYKLVLTGTIEDLDAPPKALDAAPFETSFKTFGPESVGGTEETFGSPGIVVLNEQAYLVQNHFYSGTVRVFKTEDPVSPEEVPQDPQGYVTGRPVDLAGEDTTLVVATGPPARSVPSNLYVFDVSQPNATNWVGVASLTNSATEGFVSRITVRNGIAYAATYKKGIQVVDLQSVRAGFKQCCDTEYFRMAQSLNTDGQGFGQENVTSIPVNGATGQPQRLEDLKAGDFVLDGQSQTLVVAVGDPGLVIVNPQTQQTVFKGPVEVIRTVNGQPQVIATLVWGQAVAIGRLSDRDVALVAGSGTPGTMLMVVDLSNPRAPKGLGFVSLTELPDDILLKDSQALLGNASSVTVVGLADPMQPRIIGTLPHVGGRLALTDAGLLLSSARSVFGGETPLGGVRTAALATVAVVKRVTPIIPVFQGGATVSAAAVEIEFGLVPAGPQVTAAEAKTLKNGVALEALAFRIEGSSVFAHWPAGRPVDERGTYSVSTSVTYNPTLAATRSIPLSRPVDLVATNVAEEREEVPGAVIDVNNDNDNQNPLPDNEEAGPVKGENDLLRVELRVDRTKLTRGTVAWSIITGAEHIALWLDPERTTRLTQTVWDVTDRSMPATIYVEGLSPSLTAGDVELRLMYTETVGKSYWDSLRVTVLAVDLDIDSDNNGLMAMPARNRGEDLSEDVERDANFPAKFILVNNNDDDRDDIADFADGYDRDGVASNADDLSSGEHFVPVVLELSKAIDLSTAKLRITYSASDPLGVNALGSEPEIRYTVAAGHLRIWRREGSAARNARSVAANPAGDYVPSAVVLEPPQLALLGFTATKRDVTLYLEGIEAGAAVSDQRILVEVDPDGAGPVGFIAKDAVRTTVAKVDLRDGADNDRQIIGGYIAWITADPDPAMPRLRVRVVPDLGNGIVTEWSMKTEYQDHGRNDEVLVPPAPQGQAQTPVTLPINQQWDIPAAIAALPAEEQVFGGKATLKLRAGSLFEQELQFQIRGGNPEDANARAFIQALPGAPWYAYGVARHESRQGADVYNQFNTRSAGPQLYAMPNWGAPDGWGVFQTDSASGHQIEIRHLWNWQENVRLGMRILVDAQTWANGFMRQQRNRAQQDMGQQAVPDPADQVANCVFSDHGPHPIEDAVAMQAFNRSRRRPYVRWDSPRRTWVFDRVTTWRARSWNYVEEVCGEVQP